MCRIREIVIIHKMLDLQVLGIVLGFMYARIVRRKKTQRDVRIWNSGQEYPATPKYSPAYTGYLQIDD